VKHKLKLLILSQWCYPEPDARILTMAYELKKRGHDVQILTGFPNYPGGKIYQGYNLKLFQKENLNGVEVIRVWLFPNHDKSAIKRILNYLSFSISALFLAPFLIKRPRVIYVYHPPATVALPAFCLKFIYKAKLVYDIQDLWPESLIASRMLSNQKILNLVNLFQNYIYRNATKITVISDGFKKNLISKGVSPEKIEVIYNWSIPLGCDRSNRSILSEHTEKFILLFAGNIGEAQGLEVVVNAAEIALKHDNLNDVQFVFLGTGSKKPKLMEMTKTLSNVSWLDRVPPSEVNSYLKKADVLLINLINLPLFKITIPSKTQSYMMIGKPILAGVEGDTKDLVEKSESGLSFIPGNSENLIENLLILKNKTKSELKIMGENGKLFYERNLGIKTGVSKFENIFLEII
jgi:colanic acid biosynthesis glycosyl transferase WcaI